MTHPEKQILISTIGAPHSIKGELRVNSYCNPQEQIIKYNPLFDAEGAEFWIEKIRVQKNVLICRFRNINDRDQAEALKGKELFTLRSNFAEIENDEEFYIEDLIGLDV